MDRRVDLDTGDFEHGIGFNQVLLKSPVQKTGDCRLFAGTGSRFEVALAGKEGPQMIGVELSQCLGSNGGEGQQIGSIGAHGMWGFIGLLEICQKLINRRLEQHRPFSCDKVKIDPLKILYLGLNKDHPIR